MPDSGVSGIISSILLFTSLTRFLDDLDDFPAIGAVGFGVVPVVLDSVVK